MYRFINELKNIYQKSEPKKKEEKTTPLSKSLDENTAIFEKRFDKSADLTIHKMTLNGIRFGIITIEGMVNKEILAFGVIRPVSNESYEGTPEEAFRKISDTVLCTSEQIEIATIEDVDRFIMSGFAVVAVDGYAKMLALGIQGFSFRSVSEPDSDVVQRGSKEGFVEPLRINMSLIRRRMKTPKMKFETMTIGSESKTDICLCYMTDIVSPSILRKLKKRLNSINLKTVMASGYIAPYLEQKGDFSFFSGVGISERPDTVCGKISEGRIAILVDGTPSALIVPFLFVEYFQTLDDYSNRAYFATFTRWLKYIAFFIAIMLPGVYVAVGSFHPELFPSQLLGKIAGSIAATPMPLGVETIVIHFVYEIMREAGLRMPQPLGHAVSIVGALVIGETAVNAGLIGAPTLMVVALTAICSYVIPSLYAPTAVLRFLFIIAGSFLGIWGVMLLFCMVLVNICGKKSFDVPYTAPVSPFSMTAMRDVFVRAGWKLLSKSTSTIQSMPGTEIQGSDDDDD